MLHYQRENLCHDPIHGYINFVSNIDLEPGEFSERDLIDHPWLQRLRQIHQLQTAWWVFPTAEHTRFPHVIGAMHLGGRMGRQLYPSLKRVHADCPSAAYVESILRLAGLLHDVGHGPFGHFFDAHYLSDWGITHETIGAEIICHQLGNIIRGIRRTPTGRLDPSETIDPLQVAWLIVRPSKTNNDKIPAWLVHLRSLLSGIYTIDNMDFVLRDAYMSGFSQKSFDIERIIHYSFFSEHGLTIVDRGIEAIVRFMAARADLFRSLYFHRTVRAIDLMLEDLFRSSKQFLFPGNPLENLDEYMQFTESSLLVDVSRWSGSKQPKLRELGKQWSRLLNRKIDWQMACQRSQTFAERDSEQSSIFSDRDFVERRLRDALPREVRDLPMRIDIARHLHRPHTSGPTSGQNFLLDSARGSIRPLSANEVYDRLPVAHRICRVYVRNPEHSPLVAQAMESITGTTGRDDPTNM